MEKNHMSSSSLKLSPEEIDTPEKRSRFTISIVGCKNTGILHACLFAEAGFKTICIDADQNLVSLIAKGKAPLLSHEIEAKLKEQTKAGRLQATSNIKAAVASSTIIAVTVPIEVDEKNKIDCSKLESICKQVGSALNRDSLVIIMCILGIGTTEDLIVEALNNTSGLRAGLDFGLAYSPLRVSDEQTAESMASHQRYVAAKEKSDLEAAATVLQAITKSKIIKTNNVKAAEAAALIEAAQLDASSALANELATLCEKAGIDYYEACGLLQDKEASLMTSTLETANTRNPLHILLEEAENLDTKLQMPALSRKINEETPKHAVMLIKDALRACGKAMIRAKVSLLGFAKNENTKSPPKKTVKELAQMLEKKGVRINVYDPYFSNDEVPEMKRLLKTNLAEAIDRADCIVILTGHDQFRRLNLSKLKLALKMPAAIVDLQNSLDPASVEKEGIIYRGLGKGVWTK
jgi:nucleotide sugar dehydrogenase